MGRGIEGLDEEGKENGKGPGGEQDVGGMEGKNREGDETPDDSAFKLQSRFARHLSRLHPPLTRCKHLNYRPDPLAAHGKVNEDERTLQTVERHPSDN